MDDNRRLTTNQESSGYAGEAFYKKQLEIANREKAQLQERLHEVETKNAYLLKSLFALSCQPPGTASTKPMPIDIVQALKRFPNPVDPSPGFSGKGSAYRRSAPTERASVNTHHTAGVTPHISPLYAPFRNRADLIGHSSAVYAVQFSPNGQLLVSASFDRSVRFWPMDRFLDKSTYDPKLSVPDAHRAPVVAVEWTFDSARVVSGGLDQSAAEWDVEATTNDPVARFLCNGLVNAVSVSPANDKLFFVGTSKNAVHLFDRREPPPLQGTPWEEHTVVMNDSVVNTIHVKLDGLRFVTGDHGGSIKTWDMRMVGPEENKNVGTRKAGLVDTTFNDDNRRPITHIHTSPPTAGEEYGRFMAVNSYDNYLRVYDRGSFLLKGKRPELKPVHALRGVHNAHWPIKSSFFLGADYRPPRHGPLRHVRKGRSREPPSRKAKQASVSEDQNLEELNESSSDNEGGHASFSSSTSEEDEQDDDESHSSREAETVGGPIQSTLMLASGSADANIYIFDVGGRAGTGSLLQTLEGHKDRVYTVDFHPYEPILASCSADAGIKIWNSFR